MVLAVVRLSPDKPLEASVLEVARHLERGYFVQVVGADPDEVRRVQRMAALVRRAQLERAATAARADGRKAEA